METEKSEEKINFHIAEANLCKNSHLPVSCKFTFKHFTRIYIRQCGISFLSFFFSSLVFSLTLYFLFQNRIYPVCSFIMSYCICIENENNLQFCMFCKVFVDKLETSWKFVFTTTCRSTNYFPQILYELTFESLKFNLKTLICGVSLANSFSKISCTFICSFLDIHLFLINCYFFQCHDRLWTFSAHFCSFTYRFCSFLLVYHLPVVYTPLWVASTHFYSFTQGSTSFIKLGLKNGFHQLESSLASHPTTIF